MSSSSEDHNCPICLEPVFQPVSSVTDANGDPIGSNNKFNIGATVPCGHLYHYDCFGSWQASKSYGCVKCPTCNVKTENFVRLYLDVGSLAGMQCQLAEEDDISISSIDDDKPDDDDRNEDGETEVAKENHPQKDDGGENDDVVDLTESPVRRESQSLKLSKTNTIDGDDDPQRQSQLKRFVRIAKKFKRQYLQKSAQYKEQYTEKRKLSDRVRHAEGELSSIQEGMSELERDRELTELKLNESRLDLMRIKNERDTLKSRFSTVAVEKSRAESRLKECHSHYVKELEVARTKSMSEVQEVLEEHPKVVEENRILKQKLQKLNRSLSRIDTGSLHQSNSKDINRALRQMDQQLRSRQKTVPPTPTIRSGSSQSEMGLENRNQTGRAETNLDFARTNPRPIGSNSSTSSSHARGSASIKVNSGQYSSLASRMMKASQKSKRSAQGAVAGKKRPSITCLLSQNKRRKSVSASRRDIFERKSY